MEHSGEGKSTWGTKVSTSAGKFFGWKNRIYGRDNEHSTVYMTRFWIGRLRLHVFWRGDYDPDWHDHPWGFWTFPLNSYVEEVVIKDYDPATGMNVPRRIIKQVVPAFRLQYRPATHTHRVLGKFDGHVTDDFGFTHRVSARQAADLSSDLFRFGYDIIGKVVTVVWRGKDERKWGFLKNRDGRWCWVHWKEYVFRGGKDAPCSD
ncbi:MAG: hypothetical protein DI533_20140 [Cereibacter sphaeroides]|uniref:Uncharacterized protein n=1 Tax=Cereibacter sphaeroides TaxID=1063 RepID=A0A2W5TWK6_CERSP|nr:MAG: hypothetical protein DI533_20140 [Cereibacter sphaeroides]